MRARKVLLLAGALAALYALLRSFSGPHRFSGSRPTLTELFRASETDKVSETEGDSGRVDPPA